MMLYLELFYVFFKIGLFGFGGGYAMLTLIQGEVVSRHSWLTMQEFTDIVAISQMTPGPIGINSATFVGYQATGSVLGGLICTLAVILPSFILMFTVSRLILKNRHNHFIEAAFQGIRPAVIGLLAAATLLLMNRENFSTPTENLRDFLVSVALFLLATVLTLTRKVSCVKVIILSGLLGWLLF